MSEAMSDERLAEIRADMQSLIGGALDWSPELKAANELLAEVERLRALVPPMPIKEALRITENVVMPKRLLRIAVGCMAEDAAFDGMPEFDEMRALLGEVNDE